MQKVFAEVGNSLQQIGGDCPAGWIEMSEQRPNAHFVAELVDGVAVWVAPAPAVQSCTKRQGELVLLDEPSPSENHPSFLHWLEAHIDAEQDPIEKRRMQAYFNAATWSSDDPFVMHAWQAAGRDLTELPSLFARANTL